MPRALARSFKRGSLIGGHLGKALLMDGYEVDAVGNISTGRRKNLPDGALLLKLDLRHPMAC